MAALALVGPPTTAFLPQVANASTVTSYVTANLAGANSTYGATAQSRVSHTATVRYAVGVGHPSGIAVQEACRSTNVGEYDSLDKLVQDWVTNGGYEAHFVLTGKRQGTCKQADAVFATGSAVAKPAPLQLPDDGTGEDRYAICLVTQGFVVTTNCSTHITKVNDPGFATKKAQANAARNYLAYLASSPPASYGAWLGGDFNSQPTNGPWSFYTSGYSEADRFLARDTAAAGKVDYGWGFVGSATVSLPGATLAGRGETSDHDLIWAPYTWH